MTGEAWATERPMVRGSQKQKAALRVTLGKLLLPPAERAVLDVIAEHANGAGYAWPSIATIERESGYKRAQVCRALRVLCAGDEPLVERQRFLRTADNSPRARSARGRRGQGASTYRLGRVLRTAAGLYEVDETPKVYALAEPAHETPKNETPKTSENTCTLGSLIAVEAPKDETPERRNGNKPSLTGGVETNLGVGTSARAKLELHEMIEQARLASVAAQRGEQP